MQLLLVKKLFKAFLYLIALCFFILHIYKVVVQYQAKRTNYSTSIDGSETKLKPPSVTICPENPVFSKKTDWGSFRNDSFIINRDFKVSIGYGQNRINVTHLGKYKSEESGVSLFNVYEIMTKTNGICYNFAPQLRIGYDNYINVFVETIQKEEGRMFNIFFHLESELISLVFHDWPYVAYVTARSGLGQAVGTSFLRIVWKKLPEKGECEEYDPNDSVVRCAAMQVLQKFKDQLHCQTIQFKTLFELLNATRPYCSSLQEADLINQLIRREIYNTSCLALCKYETFKETHHVSKFGSANQLLITFKFKAMLTEIYEEFLVYDFINFIGTVGGSLGLFIGFSFIDFTSYINDFLFRKCLPKSN